MPQADDEQRNLMEKWFGDCVGDRGPMVFLESHGYTLTGQFQWLLPVPHHTVSCFELECITFLFHEWDFGGIKNDHKGDTVCLCGKHSYARTSPATNA